MSPNPTDRPKFVRERTGAWVATILETDESVVEVIAEGPDRFRLVIHQRGMCTDEWDDVSAPLAGHHFAQLGMIPQMHAAATED